MKKKKKLLLLIIPILLLVVGCGDKTKEEVVKALTGEEIKVTVNMKDDYDLLKENDSLYATKKGEKKARIVFITKDNYDDFNKIIDKLNVIDKGEKEGNNYLFYSTSEQYNYVLLIKDSKTAVSISSNNQNDTKEAFEHVTFSK